MDKIRAAVIGCGGMAKRHVIGYLRSEQFEIVALADLHEAAMQEYCDEFDIRPKRYTDAREMMEKELPDVVSLRRKSTMADDLAPEVDSLGVAQNRRSTPAGR